MTATSAHMKHIAPITTGSAVGADGNAVYSCDSATEVRVAPFNTAAVSFVHHHGRSSRNSKRRSVERSDDQALLIQPIPWSENQTLWTSANEVKGKWKNEEKSRLSTL